MNLHLVRSCPYWHESEVNVWLTEFTQGAVNDLLSGGLEMCEPCYAVVSSPPMFRPDGGDDGRMMWWVSTHMREDLRQNLMASGYELVSRSDWSFDGHLQATWSETWRGPCALVTVDWNGQLAVAT